jgi:transposase
MSLQLAHRGSRRIASGRLELHHNVLAIALANKLARIAWSVLAHDRNFETRKVPASAQ